MVAFSSAVARLRSILGGVCQQGSEAASGGPSGYYRNPYRTLGFRDYRVYIELRGFVGFSGWEDRNLIPKPWVLFRFVFAS